MISSSSESISEEAVVMSATSQNISGSNFLPTSSRQSTVYQGAATSITSTRNRPSPGRVTSSSQSSMASDLGSQFTATVKM